MAHPAIASSMETRSMHAAAMQAAEHVTLHRAIEARSTRMG
jgi:hypothetical protein